MAKSLQEQLLGAGLVDQKKAKAIKQAQRKQKKQQKQTPMQTDEQAERLAAERQAKQERDRSLNRQRQEEAREREILAQIKQLITQHRISKNEGETAYQFVDDKKIRKLYVTPAQQDHLAKGRLAIVKLDEDFEIVPRVVADKIAQRNASLVITCNAPQETEADENDPYADYKIPDDLMW